MERIPSEDRIDSTEESEMRPKNFRNYRGNRNDEPRIIMPKKYGIDESNNDSEPRVIIPGKYNKDDSSKKCLCMGGPAVLATVVFVSLCSFAWCIACIVIGAKYQNKCNAQPFISTWLILHGILLVLLKICGALAQRDRKNGRKVNMGVKVVAAIVVFVVVGWLILGNVLVWTVWEPDYTHPWYNYGCDPLVFKLAVASVITLNILVVLSILVTILIFLAAARDH
ncbi:uncharacterized protein LOC143021083 [Oratosquilla oratoria]|uniref:uncharacterized protein LOC143021083 n=1 Tax=Oratosquilla oratoria TaxID=337810 RepID=UPI003F761031